MDYVIRPVRADEWQQAKELRLAALRDPAAPVAFLETYETCLERTDDFWRERTLGASEDGAGGVRQFVAEGSDGSWAGTVSVLIERPDGDAVFGGAAVVHQAHVVGVFVRPEARGRGLIDELFRAGTDWAWSLGEPLIERVRLYVHEDNPRAAAVYRRIGFVPTGETVPMPGDPTARELEYAVPRP
ncbi:GNAT family N-acetyltransferase [Streptomyces sp. NBC_00338]|uniref:GNAT family N-acetyltransferase n=1 Tax=Streptomyces sp. NBC_00338 TaxID=2975715 RepID=UPI0022591A7E|nr:GNAT family N-acetyltransferase [Streptomyces sp. NBC_00338]MCX5141679.1 GNAT family N-acetyltransferase [Streptomyces sp. NBC_00338]